MYTLAIDKNGKAWGWGTNLYGELGDNSTVGKSTPIAVCGAHTFCHISAGKYFTGNAGHSSSIDKNGKAWTWGSNDFGYLGNNSTVSYSTPIAVCGAHTFCQISCGEHTTLAIDKDGKAWAWGYNYYGSLGNNSTVCYSTPVAVCGAHTFCQIKALSYNCYALDNHNNIWAWGPASGGMLGNNVATGNYSTPIAVCGLEFGRLRILMM